MNSDIVSTYFKSFNGTKLRVYNFGGTGPVLLLAHATGFNARAYSKLASQLIDTFTVIGIDAEGHGGSDVTPDGNKWSNYPQHIAHYLEAQSLRQVYGFGHSYGGAALLQLAAQHPNALEALVAYEPVVFPGHPTTEPNFSSPITQLTLKRQFIFESREQAIANFESKPPMSYFSSGVVADYVSGGTFINANGLVELSCERSFEASIYAHAQMAGVEAMLPKIKGRVTYLYGEKSKDFSLDFFSEIEKKTPSSTLQSIESVGHFGPFEDPVRIGDIIRKSLTANDQH